MRACPLWKCQCVPGRKPKGSYPKVEELQKTDSSTAPNHEKVPGHFHVSRKHSGPCRWPSEGCFISTALTPPDQLLCCTLPPMGAGAARDTQEKNKALDTRVSESGTHDPSV